jgi:hypothetical protein
MAVAAACIIAAGKVGSVTIDMTWSVVEMKRESIWLRDFLSTIPVRVIR